MDLENKIILITGSSKGIGEATAYSFAKEKARIIVTYNSDLKGAQKVADKCKELGSPDVLAGKLNVQDSQSIRDAVSEVEEKFGHIDVLVNNAGVIGWEKFENETFDEIENQIRTNLEGLIKVTSACLPQIKEGIINVASRAGHMAFPGRSVYCATKFGVIGFTKSIALDYPDLRIFSVSPGATKTEMWNYDSGADPAKVADLIVKGWIGKVKLKNGDLNIWELVK